MADKPEFLKQSSAASSSSGGEKFPNVPQKMGTPSEGGPVPGFENRPQPMGPEKSGADTSSQPGGGKLPYPGPAKVPATPFRLKG